jgi:hypothetical protein
MLGKNPNDFNGEWNEREILLHAFTLLKGSADFQALKWLFPNVPSGKEGKVDAILIDSGLFKIQNAGYYWHHFKLTNETAIKIADIGVSKFLDEYFFEIDMLAKQKAVDRETRDYENAEVKQRFYGYGKLATMQKVIMRATIFLVIVGIIAIIANKC